MIATVAIWVLYKYIRLETSVARAIDISIVRLSIEIGILHMNRQSQPLADISNVPCSSEICRTLTHTNI